MIIEHFAYVLLVQYYLLQFMVSAKQHHKDEEKEVKPDDFRFVLDRLVHWIEEKYKCVEVDRTE